MVYKLFLVALFGTIYPGGTTHANTGWDGGVQFSENEHDFPGLSPIQEQRTVSVSELKREAVALICSSSGFDRVGVLILEEINSEVTINGEIRGLPKSAMLGFHVHENGDLRNETNPCDSTGGHFNPYNRNHGGPGNNIKHRHVGDLGNIQTDENGVAKIIIRDRIISLGRGKQSIVGRAFVVHQGKDDLGKGGSTASMTNGNSGKRIACGIIGSIYQKN